MKVKQLIASLLNKAGYEIKRTMPLAGFEIDILELAVKARLFDSEPFRFVQIGANDGKIDDPIYQLISRYQLEGVLVEPVPDFFDSLVKTYQGHPNLSFENSAIAAENGTMPFFKLTAGNPYPPEARGLAGFDKRILLEHEKFLPGIEKYIETISVKTITLQSLIDKYLLNRIDLLQIDTEGYDFEILKMVFATAIRPDIINFEFVHLTPADRSQSLVLLADNGYRFINGKKDTLAVRVNRD